MTTANGQDTSARVPHSTAAEEHLLGALLIDPNSWPAVSDVLPTDIYRPDHRLIFDAIAELARAGKGHDVLLVADRLERAGHLADAGGLAYLGTLARDTATSVNIRGYADIILEHARLRCLTSTAREIEGAIADGKTSAEIAEGLAKPLARFRASTGPRLFDARRAAIGPATFTQTQPPPEFIVDGLLPCDIGARVGAGGAAKSTLDLWEAVHLILGWKLYGREVMRPGKVLIISAEDSRDRIRFRLRMLCEQMLDLTDAMKSHIAASLLIEDLTGKGVRLVAVDADGNLTQTSTVDAVIDAYADAGLSLVSFDPFVYFGPGERFVNDAEAAMAQAAHRIRNGLNCAVRYIHHTGKANAREGRTDQYSARGGSALPDGMRFVQVLSRVEQRSEATPAQITDDDIIHGRTITLHVPKLTDAPPISGAIWIRRTGWRFEHIVARQDDEQHLERERMRRLYDFVLEQSHAGIRHSARSLENHSKALGTSRDGLRASLHAALELGHLAEMELPKTEQKGAKKSYLAAGSERP